MIVYAVCEIGSHHDAVKGVFRARDKAKELVRLLGGYDGEYYIQALRLDRLKLTEDFSGDERDKQS